MVRAMLPRLLLIVLVALSLAGCELVGGIFKAGLWVGIVLVLLVLALVMWIAGKARS